MAITIGSSADFVRRLRAVLPRGWFPSPPAAGEAETAPTLVGYLAGPANACVAIWNQIGYLLTQARISTATGPFLDMTAIDYFGVGGLQRNTNETDKQYRVRIQAALFPLRNTRQAVSGALKTLTGVTPLIVEPRRAADTKGYGGRGQGNAGGGYGYDGPGNAYGSRLTPFQSFIVVDNTQAELPASTIYQTTHLNLPVAYVAWVQIKD